MKKRSRFNELTPMGWIVVGGVMIILLVLIVLMISLIMRLF